MVGNTAGKQELMFVACLALSLNHHDLDHTEHQRNANANLKTKHKKVLPKNQTCQK